MVVNKLMVICRIKKYGVLNIKKECVINRYDIYFLIVWF